MRDDLRAVDVRCRGDGVERDAVDATLVCKLYLWLLNRGPAEGYSAEDTGQSSPERWRSFRTYRADGRAHSSSGSGSKFSSSLMRLSRTHSS